VARQTRAQRRARRAEQERQQNGAEIAVQRQARTAARPEPAEAPRGGGFRRFVGESVAELKKVEWPNQKQLIQGTAVVLIACIVVGTYLWVADLAFKRLVQNVFL
jgi:preprotein translocase subunit SecE